MGTTWSKTELLSIVCKYKSSAATLETFWKQVRVIIMTVNILHVRESDVVYMYVQ
jgi:hypothetical protein